MAIYRLCGIPGVTAVAGVIVVAGDGVGDASTAEGERFAGGVPDFLRRLDHASRVRIRLPLFCT